MNAIVCKSFGHPQQLEYTTVEKPRISAHEVLIKVAYCGVNFPDTLIVQGKYQFRPDFPFSPGGEVSGEIVEVGSRVKDFKVGDLVLAAMGWGGFAEYAVANTTNTYSIPAEVNLIEAAVFLETYGTAVHALKDRAVMKPWETLVVLGASGGTGTAAVQLGSLFGAKVIGVASTEEKRKFVIENGAKNAIPYEGLKETIKELGGADVIFDPVGGEVSEQAFRALKPWGRHLVVGFASGKIPSIPFNLPLLKSASIVGVFWGNFWRNEPMDNRRNINMLLKWMGEGKLQPQVTHKYPLEEGSLALSDIMDRKVKGKVVLEV